MTERLPNDEENTPRIQVTRHHDPIRAAIFEAEYGDKETAFKIVRGEIDFVDVDPTDVAKGIEE